MKRLTVDIEHVKLPPKQLASKLCMRKKRMKKIFKREKIKLSPKKPKDLPKMDLPKIILKEHNYVNLNSICTPSIPIQIRPFPITRVPPDQLSFVPTQTKVNIRHLTKSPSTSPQKKSNADPKDNERVASCMIESNGKLFNAAIKKIILKIQSAVDNEGGCIMRKIAKHLGEGWVMSKFIPIKARSDRNGYSNFMQLSMDMNKVFALMTKKLQLLKLYRTLNSLSRLERIFYSEVVGCLAVDKALGRVLYPLYATTITHVPSKPITPLKLRKKIVKNKTIIQDPTSSKTHSPIVILSDDEKREAKLATGLNLLSTTIISNNFQTEFPQFQPTASTPITEPTKHTSTSSAPEPIQIRSEESEEGYTMTTALKKQKSNKPRGEFENYMRFLVEKYLDKDTPITSQKKENLEMVIKQASVMYPEQYHDVRKRIRSILRNTRRNKSRLLIRNLQDFRNSASFNNTSSPSTPQFISQAEKSRQIVVSQPPIHILSPFTSFTKQSTLQLPEPIPISTISSITSVTSVTSASNSSFFGTDISKRTQGVRFKIPQHLEVLQHPPLVSVEGDLAKQFALYNYIASQKDSEGHHLCSHFLEHTANKDENVRLRQPIDMRTIALKIKICWYASLKDLVKDLELMLDNNIKLHQLRSFVGRDALKLRQLMISMVKELVKEDDVVDLTSVSGRTHEVENNLNNNKWSKKQQLNNFFQALENYRDVNSRVLLFTFLFPPAGLKPPLNEKNFPTLTDVKLKLKNNSYASLTEMAHSVLQTIHTFLSVYVPKSQAFRDSEEMAKYVQLLYKEQTGESMRIVRTVPKQYGLTGKKGQFTLALHTADFLEISYTRLFQCFTIVTAGENDIQALHVHGMPPIGIPITHLVPFKEVENLINQKLKSTYSDSNQEPVFLYPTSPISPSQNTPAQTPTQSTPTQSTPTQSTTQGTPTITNMFNSIKLKSTSDCKLKSYHFPSLMFKQYVIKRELCIFLGWCEETFEVLFHSLRQIRAGQAEKDHLFKVYKVHENHRYPFFLIQYQEIRELKSMGENNKGNKLIADIFRQGFPQGILKGSCNKWSNFLQFVDDRSNTYFIIRELMNKMNVTLQDMMLVMKLKVYQLDENQGLFWIKEWESIVNKIQKNPRYLESMVCLYNEQLEIGLDELEYVSKTGQVRGKMLINRFFQKMQTPNSSSDSNRADPITISSEDEERRDNSIQRQFAPETEEQFVSLSDLGTYLGWSETQIESVFAQDQRLQMINETKFLAFSHVNQILESINHSPSHDLNISTLNVTNKSDAPRLWIIPNMKEKHIMLEDLGEYANIPMEVLETSYQVYIYDVKSDKDRTILFHQGFNLEEYTNKPIRMIDHNKVKWILDMKAKKETINFKSRTKENKKINRPKSPPKTELQLKDLSIQLTKTQVDPVKMFKYNVFQLLTVDCKVLSLQFSNKKIKLKIMDSEKLRKPHMPIKVYTVSGKGVVISHHLAEYTNIPQSNLFLFLLSYGITYYSNTAPTGKLRSEFEQYNLELKSQGVPKYKNVTIYPYDELEQLLLLRKVGFYNVKLIETFNLIQTTNENQLTIALTSNIYHKKGTKQNKCSYKDTYSIDFKVHTIRDAACEKIIILKIFDDHYLFKSREQIMVYYIDSEENEKVSLILLHDLARFTNIPLTRLQTILNNYSIPSLSNTSTEAESQATFKRYFNQLHTFGVPHYMKHTTMYHLEHLNSLLHLREVGFFNEKLLDVYKMIKLSPPQQKRILLTIKPTAPSDKGTKRPSDTSAGSPQTKIPKSSSSSFNKSNESEKIIKKGLATAQIKVSLKTRPTHYLLASRPGEWILVSELAYFLNWTYSTVQTRLHPHLFPMSTVDDYIELTEQGAKLSVNKMLLVPVYVVSGIIDMKIKGEDLQSIKLALEEIEDAPLNLVPSETDQGRSHSKSLILVGTKSSNKEFFHNEDLETEEGEFEYVDFTIRTFWRNGKPIKLKIPHSYSHIRENTTAFPKTVTVPDIKQKFFIVEDIAEFVQMRTLELNIGLGKGGIYRPRGFPNSGNVSLLLPATEDLELFIALRRMGVPKHKVWLLYFACKKIISNEKTDLLSKSAPLTMFTEEKLDIGAHNTKLLLTESILGKVLSRHICSVYKIPGSDEMYYIAEEVAVEMQVSLIKLLDTRKLMLFKKVRRKFADNQSNTISFTMIRVDDLQHLTLLYNLGIPGPVALDIFQHLKQLSSYNPHYLHDFTSLCKKGTRTDGIKKWILIDNTEAVNVDQVASILGVTADTLERGYHDNCSRIELNSIEHVFLTSQGFQFPPNSKHCTFVDAKLLRDASYLRKLKPGRIRELFAHKPDRWPQKWHPALVNTCEGKDREFFIRTVTVEDISIRVISKENLKFTNVINIYLMQKPTPHCVVLASDLLRAFDVKNYFTIVKLCESLKVEFRDPTNLDLQCLSLQMDHFTAEKIAPMVLVQLNKHLRLTILLLALGANAFEVWRMVKEPNWIGFNGIIAALLTKPEEFDEWIFEYFTERSDNDPSFWDLSQDYPYYLAQISTPPPQPLVITNMRKALKNTDILPFWLWKVTTSTFGWIDVESLKVLLPRNEIPKSLLPMQKIVAEHSSEGRNLQSQGFTFSEDTHGFIRHCDLVVNGIDSNQCMRRMCQMINKRLDELNGEDISLHTFVTSLGRVKIFTHIKHHQKILIKKYIIATGMKSAIPMASVDQLLSLVPDESMRTDILSYITDTMSIKTVTRSKVHRRPIKFIKWTHASLFARLIELGCTVDTELMIELHNMLTKQTENVFKMPFLQASSSLWFFLEGENGYESFRSCEDIVPASESNISQLADQTLASETNESEICPNQENPSCALTSEDTELQLTEDSQLESNQIESSKSIKLELF